MGIYGKKCERLMRLLENPIFHNLIPPIYPINFKNKNIDNSNINDLYFQIEKKIGELPWIVRSSGSEDNQKMILAGKFNSKVCYNKSDLLDVIYEVIKYNYNGTEIIIPAFIQPLIVNKSNYLIDNKKVSPIFRKSDINNLIEIINLIHKQTKMNKLDCEWVLETDYGVISATSMSSIINENDISGQISFGFGLFTSQTTNYFKNSVVYFLKNGNELIWNGENFQLAEIKKNWLVQFRPANYYGLFSEILALDEQSSKTLELNENCKVVNITEILSMRTNITNGMFIIGDTLNAAWKKFEDSKYDNKYVAAIVQYGTANEHAAIMFKQYNIAVIKINFDENYEFMTKIHIDYFRKKCYFYYDNINFETLKFERKEIFSGENSFSFYCPPYLDDFKQLVIKKNSIILPKISNQFQILINLNNKCIGIPKNLFDDKRKFLKLYVIKKFYGKDFRTQKILLKLVRYLIISYEENIFQTFNSINCIDRLLSYIKDSFLYNENEKKKLIDKVDKLLENTSFLNNISYVNSIIEETFLSADLLITLFDISIISKENFETILVFFEQFNIFKNTNNPQNGKTLIDHYENILKVISAEKNLVLVLTNNLIELFDYKAKTILKDILEGYRYEEIYCEILKVWMSFLNVVFDRKYKKEFNLISEKYLKHYLINNDYSIRYITWSEYLHKLYLNFDNNIFKNFHEIHNFLHQLSLSLDNNYDYYKLPCIISHLITISNSFTKQINKLIVYNRNYFEVELPITLHKTSFRFYRNRVFIEFSEAYDYENMECGRIFFFKKMFNIYKKWYKMKFDFEYYTDNIKNTNILYLVVNCKEQLTLQTAELIYNLFRILIDTTHDLSGITISELIEFDSLLENSKFKKFFEKLLIYRKNFIGRQFDNPRVYGLSRIFTYLITNFDFQKFFLNTFEMSFDNIIEIFSLMSKDIEEENNFIKWDEKYNKLELITVILASIWPQKILKKMKGFKKNHTGFYLLCQNVLVLKQARSLFKNDKLFSKEEILFFNPYNVRKNDSISLNITTSKKFLKYRKIFIQKN